MDAFHKNGAQLYQVFERLHYDGKLTVTYTTQGLLADALKQEIPGISYAGSLEYAATPGSSSTLEAGDKISKQNGRYAGEDFLRMFSFPLLQGNAQTALTDPADIAISRHIATLFFGSPEKAMGQYIRYENRENLWVSAVFENLPAHSSLQFDFLRSWVAFIKANPWVHNWGNTSPAILAIVISCLGLFGLATFTATRRTKEIGVRKVLGAAVTDIVFLLSRHFLVLVVIAMLVTFPIAWWMMQHWLQDFAYKIDLDWWMFAAAGIATMLIALLTVSHQSIRAAILHPVKSLRTE